MTNDLLGIQQFLRDYPLMSLKPSTSNEVVFEGVFEFIAKAEGRPEIEDSYHLRLVCPFNFPKTLPKVWELDKKIPKTREGDFHINPDGSLCLGSPLRLLIKANEGKSLVAYAEKCIVPYLYAISIKLKKGGKLYMGELEHGMPGIIDDYKCLFGLKDQAEVLRSLQFLSMKKRLANKMKCPCNCGLRLGKCRLRLKLNNFRKFASRSWYSKHAAKPAVLN